MSDNNILKLLTSLSPEPVSENVRQLYDKAIQEDTKNKEAIELCKKALVVLKEPSSVALGDLDAKAYAKGRIYLLMGTICFDYAEQLEEASQQQQQAQNSNEQREKINEALAKAEEEFIESLREFHKKQWSHLESLVYLSLAIVRRKLEKVQDASDNCEKAKYYLQHESVPTGINKKDLMQAINEERTKIQELSALLEEQPPPRFQEEKPFQIFKASAGEQLIATGRKRAADLNLLARRDYEQNTSPEEVIIDLIKRRSAANANYILEVDKQIDKVEDDLKQGDWLLVRTTPNNPNQLNNKTVAVLIREGDELHLSLKTFIRNSDHHFLKARTKNARSIIITRQRGNFATTRDSYAIYGEKVVGKLAHDIQITGPIIQHGHIRQDSIKNITKGFIWSIPVVNEISAGLSPSIAEENVKRHVKVRKSERKDAGYFGAIVKGDSMEGDGISNGDIALICQQPTVKNGEIAAVVIFTPEAGPLGVLKRYYKVIFKGREDITHWLLMSSNSSSEHLVIIPSGANTQAIENIYAEKFRAGKIFKPVKFFKEAEIAIAGKYVEIVK